MKIFNYTTIPWKEHIPFGTTGSICYLDNSLPETLDADQFDDLISQKLTQYYTKNIKQVFMVSSQENSEYHNTLTHLFEKQGLPGGFFRYQCEKKGNFQREIDVIDSLLSLTRSSNFAFFFVEAETRDVYSFISKALLYLNCNSLPGDIVAYFHELDWEKQEMEYLAQFHKYLHSNYYLDKETEFFLPHNPIRPLKDLFWEQKPDRKILENLVLNELDSPDSLIQNADGSYKKIEFNLNSLQGNRRSAIDSEDLDSEDFTATPEPIQPPVEKEIIIPLPQEEPGPSNIFTMAEEEFKSKSIDSLLDSISSEVPIDKTIPQLNTSQLDEIIDLNTAEKPNQTKEKPTKNLIDTDSLIDLNLEDEVISIEDESMQNNKKAESEETIPSFDIHSLITNEIGSLEEKTDNRKEKVLTSQHRDDEPIIDLEKQPVEINHLIGEELDTENDFEEGDFILEPAESQIDLLIQKELSEN